MNENTASIVNKIRCLQTEKTRIIAAIDGRCASGKTTLAEHLSREIDCNVFHMDDFFLRPEQRTERRLNELGGNVDYERFINEVLEPVFQGRNFSYRPYSCKTGELAAPVKVEDKSVNIVEGAYSCHPAMLERYDLRIFLSADYHTQLERIRARNGEEALEIFKSKWIPLEERYFNGLDIAGKCDIYIST